MEEPIKTTDGDYTVISFDGSEWRLQGEINNSLAIAIAIFLSKQNNQVTAQQIRSLND